MSLCSYMLYSFQVIAYEAKHAVDFNLTVDLFCACFTIAGMRKGSNV